MQELIEQGINKRGEYCDWITEEFIQGTSLETLLLREELTRDNWNSILEKIVHVIQQVFHEDGIEDSDELYSSHITKQIRERYYDGVKKELFDRLYELQSEFCYDNRFSNYFYLDCNAIAEWKMFIDEFMSVYFNYIDKATIIYNGTCERLVHNTLTFDNILYDTFTSQLHFINPRTRQWEIVDKNKDYALLYLSCYCGLPALKYKLYDEENDIVTISYPIQEKMSDCVYILDDIMGNDSSFIKMYSILLLFLSSSEREKYSVEQRVIMLKYARQLKNSFYKNKIL